MQLCKRIQSIAARSVDLRHSRRLKSVPRPVRFQHARPPYVRTSGVRTASLVAQGRIRFNGGISSNSLSALLPGRRLLVPRPSPKDRCSGPALRRGHRRRREENGLGIPGHGARMAVVVEAWRGRSYCRIHLWCLSVDGAEVAGEGRRHNGWRGRVKTEAGEGLVGGRNSHGRQGKARRPEPSFRRLDSHELGSLTPSFHGRLGRATEPSSPPMNG